MLKLIKIMQILSIIYKLFTLGLFIDLFMQWNEITVFSLNTQFWSCKEILLNIVYAKARCSINRLGIDGAPRRGGVWVTGPRGRKPDPDPSLRRIELFFLNLQKKSFKVKYVNIPESLKLLKLYVNFKTIYNWKLTW